MATDLATLKSLLAATTQGDWMGVAQGDGSTMIAHQYETGNQVRPLGLRLVCHVLARRDTLAEDQANAAFIVAAQPSVVLRLLNEVEAERAKVEALRDEKAAVEWMLEQDRAALAAAVTRATAAEAEVARLREAIDYAIGQIDKGAPDNAGDELRRALAKEKPDAAE